MKRARDATINDVILTAVAGALGSYMRRHEFETDELVLKALVPVSVRDADDGPLGNRIAAMWAPLPVGLADPVERLSVIAEAMSGVKRSGQAVGAQALTELAGFASPTLVAQAARLQARQRLFNLVVTNVPGPQSPLYLLGRRMRAVYPLVPLAANTALGIAVLSYDGSINFGLNADYDALPDLESLARDLEQSIAQIVQAAPRRPPETLAGPFLRKVADRERDARDGAQPRLIVGHLNLPHPRGAAGVLAGRARVDGPARDRPQEARLVGEASSRPSPRAGRPRRWRRM